MRALHVVVMQYRLLHYRTGLFDLLRERCKALDIELDLVVGQASPREAMKKDEGSLDWAHKVENRFWELPDRDLVWQPFPKSLRRADLVVLMQENRILSNYPLILRRWLGGRQRIAYWGHGRNFQSDAPEGWRERWKRFMLKRVDWWFAYTTISEQLVRDAGFPPQRITCLNNAIDTDQFRADLAAVSDQEVLDMKAALGIAPGDVVALFCGSLYQDKRVDLLVSAMDHVRLSRQDATLLVVGDGPSMPELQSAAATRRWLKVVGAKRGREKALCYRMATLILNPGAVGLHVVDAFCAGLVMLTTASAKHGPEVAYIDHGRNGLLLDADAQAIGDAVLGLLGEPTRLLSMQQAALADADRYTLTNMVERFAQGALQAMGATRT